MFENAKAKALCLVPAGVMTGVALAPAAFAEGETSSTVSGAITNMASTVATDGQSMLVGVIPVLAPLVGAVIIAGLGYKFVKRFSK